MSRATTAPRSPFLLPVLLVVVGAVLLIGNFLLVGVFNVGNLGFLLLVVLGVMVLLRGDAVPSADARTFGITRGSVESASLIINASDIDVVIEPLASLERLISGQYAYNARPGLAVEGTHAALVLDRRHTSLLTFADWEMALAPQMPWAISCSTSFGQIDADLSGLIIDQAEFYSGIGSICLVAPQEVLGDPIIVKATLGNIHLQTPPGYGVRVRVAHGRFFRVHVDTARYTVAEDGLYLANDAHTDALPTDIVLSGSFGDVYLS